MGLLPLRAVGVFFLLRLLEKPPNEQGNSSTGSQSSKRMCAKIIAGAVFELWRNSDARNLAAFLLPGPQ
jgi:hypothetical protein